MLEDELHQSAAGDTPPEPEAKESDAAVPAEETGSIPEKTTAAEPAEGDVPPEPPKWKKVLQTAKKVVMSYQQVSALKPSLKRSEGITPVL